MMLVRSAILGLQVLSAGVSAFNEHSTTSVSRQVSTVRQNVNACKIRAPGGVYLSLGFGPTNGAAPSKGTLNAAMIFVEFPDAKGTVPAKGIHDTFLPAGAKFFNESSYGRLKLNVRADFSRFYPMPRASNTYVWTSAQTHGKYVNDAISSIGAKSKFGKIDVLYIMSPPTAKLFRGASTYNAPGVKFTDGSRISRTVTFGAGLRDHLILNHETGHTMGLPDLYPLGAGKLPVHHYVGGWDVMGVIGGTAPDYFAWSKWKLGWIDDNQVQCISRPGTTEHTLTPLSTAGGLKLVTLKLNETSTLNIELRTRAGVDKKTCTEGLLFYIANAARATGNGPYTVLDPHSQKGKGCAPFAGPLTSAAMDFKKGEKSISFARFGLKVEITGTKGANYSFKVIKT